MGVESERLRTMTGEKILKFTCPQCGQHLEADYDMVGMVLDCPGCGQSFQVPGIGGLVHKEDASFLSGVQSAPVPPLITVIKKRESFIGRYKNRVKAVGIGVAVLLLFVGVGVIKGVSDEGGPAAAEKAATKAVDRANARAVMTSIECLLNYVAMPNDRRLSVLSQSLESCPKDFADAVKEFIVSASRTTQDMISDKEREDMIKGKIALGLIFGAANQNDPRSGVAAGLQLGDLISAEAQEKANRRLKQEIESKLNRLLDVAQKYGVDPNKLEEALLGRGR